MSLEKPTYPTIQVVPIDEVKAELEKLYRRIDDLEAILITQSKTTSNAANIFSADILTTKEVVEQYPVSVTTLYRLEKTGELLPVKKTKGVNGKTGKKFYDRFTVELYFRSKDF
jgi:hypothetical protein